MLQSGCAPRTQLAGELAPGAPLVETTLAAQLAVSHGSLREARRELIEEVLLVTVRYMIPFHFAMRGST